ncbi:MAG: hypothetical protein Q8R34_01415 [bacterium]|nr:hypothetical protein [bacterium]
MPFQFTPAKRFIIYLILAFLILFSVNYRELILIEIALFLGSIMPYNAIMGSYTGKPRMRFLGNEIRTKQAQGASPDSLGSFMWRLRHIAIALVSFIYIGISVAGALIINQVSPEATAVYIILWMVAISYAIYHTQGVVNFLYALTRPWFMSHPRWYDFFNK